MAGIITTREDHKSDRIIWILSSSDLVTTTNNKNNIFIQSVPPDILKVIFKNTCWSSELLFNIQMEHFSKPLKFPTSQLKCLGAAKAFIPLVTQGHLSFFHFDSCDTLAWNHQSFSVQIITTNSKCSTDFRKLHLWVCESLGIRYNLKASSCIKKGTCSDELQLWLWKTQW